MVEIGINEQLHELICDYVEGRISYKKKKILEEVASKRKAIRDLIHDSKTAREILLKHRTALSRISLK